MKFVGQLLGTHWARYTSMQVEDVYKLLHQAALGPAHAVEPATVRTRLDAELAGLGTGPDEPLADVISPDGRLARVHLRPYVARGLPVDALAAAFTRTAAEYTGSTDKLAKFCGCLGDLAETGGLPFPRAAIEAYMDARRGEGWPAVRHSDTYRQAYAPAYRVVDVTLLPGIIQ